MGRIASTSLVLVVAALGLAACGDDSGSSATTSSPSPPLAVDTTDNAFAPQQLDAKVGQTITWTNTGRNQHNIVLTPDSPPADKFGATFDKLPPGGGTYSYAFTAPGTYAYYCSIHGTKTGKGMAATVVVTG